MNGILVQKLRTLMSSLEVENSTSDKNCRTEAELLAFENESGIILPAGYKEFCLIFGECLLGGYMRVHCPSLEKSAREIEFLKDEMEIQIRKGNLDIESLSSLVNSAFVFADNAYGQTVLWDLRTYNSSDESYDIYLAPLNGMDGIYRVGRDFFGFLREFCLGMKSYELLPEHWRPRVQELRHTFSYLPRLENSHEEKIWQQNTESGVVLKLAQTYEQQGLFTEALVLYLKHQTTRLSYSEVEDIFLLKAFKRIYETIGDSQFRKICLATVGSSEPYKKFFANMYGSSADTVDSQAEAEEPESLDDFFLESIPAPAAEFLQVWQASLQSIRNQLAAGLILDKFEFDEQEIWWKNTVSGAALKLANYYKVRGQIREALVLCIKAFNLTQSAYSCDNYLRTERAMICLKTALGDAEFYRIWQATTGSPIHSSVIAELNAKEKNCDVSFAFPSNLDQNLPKPDANFLRISEVFLKSVCHRLAADFVLERACREQNFYDKYFSHLNLPPECAYIKPARLPDELEMQMGEEIRQALRSNNQYAFFRYLKTLRNHTAPVYSVIFSPDGKNLVSSSADCTIKIWDLSTIQEIRTLMGHTDAAISLAMSPDGRVLASGSADTTIKLWDLCTGDELHTLSGHASSVLSVAISPDGKTLASGSADTTIKLWDLGTGQAIFTLTGHASSVLSVAISPDGQTLASGSADTTIKLWDLGTGQEIRLLDANSGFVFSVCFHPLRQLLASAHGGPEADRTINLWDLNTGEVSRTIAIYEEVVSVKISPDGQSLANVGGRRTNIGLWDLDTGKVITTFEAQSFPYHQFLVHSVAFSPDGQMLASGGQDTTVKLWGISPALNIE